MQSILKDTPLSFVLCSFGCYSIFFACNGYCVLIVGSSVQMLYRQKCWLIFWFLSGEYYGNHVFYVADGLLRWFDCLLMLFIKAIWSSSSSFVFYLEVYPWNRVIGAIQQSLLVMLLLVVVLKRISFFYSYSFEGKKMQYHMRLLGSLIIWVWGIIMRKKHTMNSGNSSKKKKTLQLPLSF